MTSDTTDEYTLFLENIAGASLTIPGGVPDRTMYVTIGKGIKVLLLRVNRDLRVAYGVVCEPRTTMELMAAS